MQKSIFLAATGVFATHFFTSKINNDTNLSTTRHAICILYPNGNSGVKGLVSFSQENIMAPTKIVANVQGLKPNSLHAFHVHEYGDLTAGPHYNPYNKSHGGPLDKERHIGDLGNLKTDTKGNAYMATTDALIKLFGDTSIVGRSCVIHENEDDLGRGNFPDSKTTGHSGPRVACGVIGLAEKFKNLPPN